MSLEDVLGPDEGVEHAGPEVTYDGDDYDTYFTSGDRLLLHKERGFISKEDDWTSWDLERIENVKYETGGTAGPESGAGMAAGNVITIELGEGKKIEIECPRSDLPDFVAEARKRVTE
ncbi:hypothetical protein AKJ65_04130 [candidate division MSBL1 archaeon SCGC-AAA259E19]|uniref:YokE-like PH domain-containing protein n=1 Tax=candidate division MSBL1 archaeon SCGC-AAA259E19 TaxID=1698264 RepID=A0A133UK14_9EURY|nr:hypothetical protein AKJ65_04130 [candidate division MSBL1 archaeon SCGC-AAA259E19]